MSEAEYYGYVILYGGAALLLAIYWFIVDYFEHRNYEKREKERIAKLRKDLGYELTEEEKLKLYEEAEREFKNHR